MEGLMQLSISVLCLSAATRLWAKININTVHSGTKTNVNYDVKATDVLKKKGKKEGK